MLRKLAIPNSKYYKNIILKLLNSKDIYLPRDKRQLVYNFPEKRLQVIFSRARDIPLLLEKGLVDAGIVTSDVIEEYGVKFKSYTLSANLFDYYICSKEPIRNIIDLNDKKIFSSFPNLTKKILTDKKINAEIIPMRGSLEGVACIDSNNVVFDVVFSGKTLMENNLIKNMKLYSASLQFIERENSDLTFFEFNNWTKKDSRRDIAEYLKYIEDLLDDRLIDQKGYTGKTFEKGKKQIIKKILEEIQEVTLEIMLDYQNNYKIEELTDLLFHYLLLLKIENISIIEIIDELRLRKNE